MRKKINKEIREKGESEKKWIIIFFKPDITDKNM